MPGLQGDEPEAGRDGTRTERPGDFRDLQGGYSTCQGLAGNLTVTGRWESQVSLVAWGWPGLCKETGGVGPRSWRA